MVAGAATSRLRSDILAVLAAARSQADALGIEDRDGFAERMLGAWLRGRVDRWILDGRRRRG